MFDPVPIPTPTPRPTAEPGQYPTFEFDMAYINKEIGNEAIQWWGILPGAELQAGAVAISFFFLLVIVVKSLSFNKDK